MSLWLTPSQVNLLLGVLIVGALGSGVASWATSDAINGWLTRLHAVFGLTILVAFPSKIRGPVRSGMRRRSVVKWFSVSFGAVVLATLGFGIVHATGIAHGVGLWTPLWTHELLGFSLIPLTVIHVVTRPSRVRPSAIGRRALLRYGVGASVAGAAFMVQRALPPLFTDARRRSTGSYEVGSHDPSALPVVYWINDRRPADTDAEAWQLTVQGRHVPIVSLWAQARPARAILDCTGGWWSEHDWDAVPLSELVSEPHGRSVRVTSSTGYARWFAHDDLDEVYLAVGYGGEPLRAGHGAPVRLVVPGRRGPDWIKWVVSVDDDNRPAWAASPLPLS